MAPEDYIAFPADDLEEGAPVVKNDTADEPTDAPVDEPNMEPGNLVDGGDLPEGGLDLVEGIEGSVCTLPVSGG